MKVHEYQAKELFTQYGIPVPAGKAAFTVEEAVEAAQDLNLPVVVKAQIHAGGRGKGGGVKLAYQKKEIEQYTRQILGMNLVTHQTGPEGKKVGRLLIEQGINIDRELYFSIVPDRASASVVIMASTEGGMDIEEVAAKTPEKIIKCFVNPLLGIQKYHLRELAFGLKIPNKAMKSFGSMVEGLYTLFMKKDCSLVEINPLVITAEEEIVAADAKLDVDSNALFRQKDIIAYRDTSEEDPLELKASEYDLNYINLDGNIGNIVNGAGLAMATMDIIQAAGAKPANFLDVGGGATSEQVEKALSLILEDENVKGVLINIFGGILRCDVFAKGIVQAAKQAGITVPVVVRMEGTNVEEGRRILDESGLSLQTAEDLADAAQKIAAIVA
ncbi:MAG: ADP-forming succinate--CoA ligase subunit beta [Desulfocapsaceae bacterium]|nr:ADP-forming succinate--CoA ligase subunit beta [Desulfocapsaceae bacterium]